MLELLTHGAIRCAKVVATGGDYSAGIGGGHYGSSSNVYVADDVVLKAGSSPNPTEVIPHASITTDVASSLAGKRFATAETVIYPDYLAEYGAAVTNKFTAWAKAYPPGDPDGVYANAFLLNVAPNREAEALAAFKIGSIAVTNGVVSVEAARPLAPATSFNGVAWLQCATNGLDEAGFLDIEAGRYADEGKAFFRQRIDFEHTLAPEAFPAEPTGGKTMRVIVN